MIWFDEEITEDTCGAQGADLVAAYLAAVDPEEQVIEVNEAFAVPLVDAQGNVLEKPLVDELDCRASKAGVMAFTKSIAREGGRRGITANAIAPGLVDTEMFQQIPEENRKTFLDQIPVGRFGKVDDIAELAVFLASDVAAYITGQVIHINGGLYM